MYLGTQGFQNSLRLAPVYSHFVPDEAAVCTLEFAFIWGSIVVFRLLTALEGTNGNKYINMDWRIDVPGNYSIAGTYFIYKRSPGRTGIGEQFFADGPTTEDLNLIVSQSVSDAAFYNITLKEI